MPRGNRGKGVLQPNAMPDSESKKPRWECNVVGVIVKGGNAIRGD
jgi:hypothetical protein